MKLEGRRSSRNLPPNLSSGVVVSVPANGDCFFHIVLTGIKDIIQQTTGDSQPESNTDTDRRSLKAPPMKKRKQDGFANEVSKELNDRENPKNNSTKKFSNYISIPSLRNLVADKYSEEVFNLMVAAGQVPCTARTIPSFDSFKTKLKFEKAFADEHCIGIISSTFSIAFLILDDNIGGKPTAYWNSGESHDLLNKQDGKVKRLPQYYLTLRLGRQHYSGIRFGDSLIQDSNNLHPQISTFWKKEIEKILT